MTEGREDLLLERLKQELAADFEPAQPLAPAWKTALGLIPVWGVLVGLSVGGFGIRADHEVLGLSVAWILALIQFVGGYLVAVASLRLVIPGASFSLGSVRLLALGAVLLHLLVSAFTYQRSPVPVPPERFWELWGICFLFTLAMGLLPLGVIATFASRGLPFSASLVGALCGLGAGLTGEAAWRMHCHYSAWEHVLSAHTAPVLAAVVVGALTGFFWQRRKQSVR